MAYTGIGVNGDVYTAQTSPGSPNFQPPASTSITIHGDSGTITASTYDMYARSGTANCGSSVAFIAPTASELNLTLNDFNGNMFLGESAGNSSVSGFTNVNIGSSGLASLTTGSANTNIGSQSLSSLVGGAANVSVGQGNLPSCVSGDANIAIGAGIGGSVTGSNNILIGESADSSTSYLTVIGVQGLQTACTIGGINGATPSTSTPQVTVTDTMGFLTTIASGTSGQVLTSNGSLAPSFQTGTGTSISITGDTGGALTSGSFTLTGGSTGLSFNGASTTETLEFAGITANGGTANIGTDSTAYALNLGSVSSTGRTITMGNTTGTTGIVEKVGTGNYIVDGVGASTYSFGPSTTSGTMSFGGTAQTGLITIGDSSATSTISLGAGTGDTTVNIANNATTGAVNIAAAATTATINIGGTSGTGLITIGSSTGTSTVSIAAGTGASSVFIANGIGANVVEIGLGAIASKTISIGNGASTNTCTFGSTAGSSTTTINSGTGGLITKGVYGITSSNPVICTVDSVTGQLGSTSSVGTVWTNESSSFAAVKSNGYFAIGSVTATMPATASLGDTIQFINTNGPTFVIQANTGQIIVIGASVGSSGGSATSNSIGDAVTFVYQTAFSAWVANAVIGSSWVVV